MFRLSRNSGSLNFQEPYGPVQACNGITLLVFTDDIGVVAMLWPNCMWQLPLWSPIRGFNWNWIVPTNRPQPPLFRLLPFMVIFLSVVKSEDSFVFKSEDSFVFVWILTPRLLVAGHRRFEWACCVYFYFHSGGVSDGSSETSVCIRIHFSARKCETHT